MLRKPEVYAGVKKPEWAEVQICLQYPIRRLLPSVLSEWA